MHKHFWLAAVFCLGLCGVAHADTFNIFNLNSVLQNGTATGTVTLNSTIGKFTNSNIRYVYTNSSGTNLITFTGAGVDNGSGTGYNSTLFSTSVSPDITFQLALPLLSLKNYGGGSLCTSSAQCGTYDSSVQYQSSDFADVTSGTLTLPPVAVTPEPSSLLLLGTGVLVIGSFIKRRRV